MLKVYIIGIGPGNPNLLTREAEDAIAKSNVLIGDNRMLLLYKTTGKTIHATIKTSEIVEIINALDPAENIVGILVSGDVGFFSLTKTITAKLTNCQVKRCPGISSLVYFAQALNMSWDDAKIISMHGRNNNLIAAVFQNHKVFSLTGGENNVNTLCKKLCTNALGDVQIYVGENLSYPEEKITIGTAEELSKLSFPSLSVMMIINEKPKMLSGKTYGLADDMFVRTKVPMTKQEVRAISISKLAPKATDIIYDIGAGTGSCSVELALQASSGTVYAFERKLEAVELIEKNKTRFNLENLNIVLGEADVEIKTTPVPDCVFIGGSGGNLSSMLNTLYAKNSKLRIVMNAITLETLAEITSYYKDKKDFSLEIVNVFIARSKKLGTYNLMMAQKPIYIITAVKKEV
ncbi:MAG: precorrin-6y C5,15-methyltransferase (decarboxylating) subunit CbiE [Acidaminococcaceae bacterium]|nr:precorrin-6y C5,15-methyltransferase (decarboxylating) subunit CbiE [Acidaminococcaceae bacterium]